MSGYAGNGTFTFTYNWVNDAANGIPITASRMDTEFADATGGFNLVICRDGQSTTTAAIPFAVGINTDTVNPVTLLGPVSFSGGQIKFPATQNPSSNANTLDDYEEGTWTPVLVGTGGGSATYSNQGGLYIKIGQLVFVSFDITLTAVSTLSGNLTIGGLPFTVANSPNARASGPMFWSGTTQSFYSMTAFAVQNSLTASINCIAAAATTIQTVAAADLANATFLRGSLVYQATA